jgi:predicted RNA methylase
MISVVLTNTDFGLGCTLSVDFGSGTGAWAAHAAAMGAFISMAIVEAREAREIVGEMVSAVNGAAVWSEGHLKLFPLTTEKLVNGAAVYTPVVTPAYDLGGRAQGSDFLADQGQAPIQVERVANVDRFNCFPIEYTSRSSARVTAAGVTLTEPNNEYTKMTYDGDAHPTDSQVRGVLKAPVLSLPCITRLPHVKLLSRLLANQSVAKTATYRFRLGWRFALLECGDLVTITEANLGLARQLVRVTEISEGDDGGFDVVAEGVGYSGTIPAATYSVS